MVRKFKGNAPNGDGWELIGEVVDTESGWLVHIRHKPDERGAGFLDVKVSANGFVPRKANYWLQWQIERSRARKGKDLQAMVENRPALAEKIKTEVADYIKAYC